MAAATTRRTAAKKTAAKPAPKAAPEVVEEELEDLEVEGDDEELEADEADEADEPDDDMDELEEDEVADSKPTSKKKAAASEDITFGIQDLIALVKKETGDVTDGRALRTLIRKMAREDNARVNRTITPGNRTRYNWTGPNDAEVVAIIAAYKGGELEAEKKAKLDALKAQKAAKTAAKKAEAEGDDDAPAPKRTAKKAAAKPAARRKAAPVVEEVEDDEELDFGDDE